MKVRVLEEAEGEGTHCLPPPRGCKAGPASQWGRAGVEGERQGTCLSGTKELKHRD